jgi:hypothetical protein
VEEAPGGPPAFVAPVLHIALTFKGTWKPGKWNTLQELYAAEFDEKKIRKAVMGRLPLAIKYVIERKKSKYQI